MTKFTESVAHYCKGMTVSVGCLGERCEFAKMEPDPREVLACATEVIESRSSGFNIEAELALLHDAIENRDEDHHCEASFSQEPCDSCGTTLHGDREEAWGITHSANQEYIKLAICVDCVMFHANGDEPDDWEEHSPWRTT